MCVHPKHMGNTLESYTPSPHSLEAAQMLNNTTENWL